jgi:putative ABC transport system substrate-binding protein
LVRLRVGGGLDDAFFVGRSKQLAALVLRHVVPTIFQYREFAAAGGLMSYGGDITDAIRLAGIYTGRILNDEQPADLPVQQALT